MKKLSTLVLGLFLVAACSEKQPKNYLTLSGQLENNTDSIITIAGSTGVLKTITMNEDGTFKDTLKVNKPDVYMFQTSANKRAPIYLKNGFDIVINGDAEKFMESFTFSGEGSENSNFVLAQIQQSQSIGNPQDILDLEETAFRNKVEKLKAEYDSILNSYNNLDSALYVTAKGQNEQFSQYFESAYVQNQVMGRGKPSPKFENYVDIKGGTKSLEDYKGKYVYIDVWATWCGPCIQEIPYLQSLEKEYRNKNIEFISISTDENRRSGGSWEAAEKKWREFVKEKDMSGVHLWAGKDINFQREYQISGIPRFILIDPQGNIVNANAPRPSDPSLKMLFNSLSI